MHPSRISMLFALLLTLLAGTPAARADATCPAGNGLSTPTADFIDNANGTVTHSKTGLMWKQCAEGLSGAGCGTGSVTRLAWNDIQGAAAAPFAGYGDWRLPNQKELRSIVETGCFGPSINLAAFPGNTPSDYFWSSTARASDPASAWVVEFNAGTSYVVNKADINSLYVRLVRRGQVFDSFDAQAKLSQTINFTSTAPTGATVGGPTYTLSATGGGSNNLVTFTSQTNSVCTVSGSTVTMVAAGTCIIAADQAGNGVYAPAPEVLQVFSVTGVMTVPGAPTIFSITPGPGRVTLTLLAPSNSGGGPIANYTATCSASGHPSVSASSATTTVVVPGLVAGASYACTATASNGSYTSPATPATSAIPTPKLDLTPILMLLLD